MDDVVNNELRWFIGKVVHCASAAGSLSEFAEWLDDVDIPTSCLATDDPVDTVTHADRATSAAGTAIDLLYAEHAQQRAMAHLRLGFALDDLRTRESTIDDRAIDLPEAARSPDEIDGGQATESDGAADQLSKVVGSDATTLDQSVVAGRDINAPIVNATGNVVISDRSEHVNRMLHDYLTYLVYVSLGVKRPHATGSTIQIVDEALEALTTYHRKTNQSIGGSSWGYFPELTRHASETWQLVDRACHAVFDLSFEAARIGLFESKFPSFDLFDDMVLIRGGFDQYTGRNVDPFYISRIPVTVAHYDEFCRETQYPRVPEWNAMSPPSAILNHPVTGVALFDTVMFCVWLETATGFRFRLPTETEWCFAATEGRKQNYPWGDDYVRGRASTQLESPNGTSPVDARPEGRSPSGVLDLVGNVWELTSTLFADDPATDDMDITFPPMMYALAREAWWTSDRRIPRGAGPWAEAARLVMRGGSWGGGPEWATLHQRIWTSMFNRGAYGGFRVVCSAERVGEGFVPTPSFLAPRVANRSERIQLTNSDGSSAVSQWDMTSCGSGSTVEGALSARLLEGAIARYEGVGDKSFEHFGLVYDTVGAVANESRFPALRPRGSFQLPESIAAVAGDAWQTDIEKLVRSRLDDEAYRIVDCALIETALLGHDRITTGHLLLALSMSDATPAAALRSLGLLPDRIKAVLASAPLAEGEQSPENVRFTDAAVRAILRDSKTPGFRGLSTVDLFHRVVDLTSGVAASILTVHDLTPDQVKVRYNLVRRVQGMQFKVQEEDRARYVELLAILDKLSLSDDEVARARAILLTVRANEIAKSGAPPEAVAQADDEAASARSDLGDAVTDCHGGLAPELRLLFNRAKSTSDEAGIRVLDEIVRLEESGGGDERPLVWALLNRGALRASAGRTQAALADTDRCLELLRDSRNRDRSDDTAETIALVLNNKASMLDTLGRSDEAHPVICESLQILFPAIVRREEQRGVTATRLADRPNLTPYESTYSDVCMSLGLHPDQAFVRYFEYFSSKSEASSISLGDLPDLDPPPLRRLAADQTAPRCDFCAHEAASVAGVSGRIGSDCIALAEEVFNERAKASRDEGAISAYAQYCSMCGHRQEKRDDSVTSGRGTICSGCLERTLRLA